MYLKHEGQYHLTGWVLMTMSTGDGSLSLLDCSLGTRTAAGSHQQLQKEDIFTMFFPQLPCGQPQLILHAQGWPGGFQ